MIATDELIRRVRHLLNEPEEDAQLSLIAEDTRSINGHILRLLPQAVALVQKNKADDAGNVNPGSVDAAGVDVIDCGDGTGMIILPEDYAAMVSLQLKGWKRPCHKSIAAGCREALEQRCEHTRAGICRPVCVDGVTADGAKALLLSPLPGDGGAAMEHFVYEARFDASRGLQGDDGVLADAVAYYCAALLYGVFERQDQANAFLSLATLLCNGKSVERR